MIKVRLIGIIQLIILLIKINKWILLEQQMTNVMFFYRQSFWKFWKTKKGLIKLLLPDIKYLVFHGTYKWWRNSKAKCKLGHIQPAVPGLPELLNTGSWELGTLGDPPVIFQACKVAINWCTKKETQNATKIVWDLERNLSHVLWNSSVSIS